MATKKWGETSNTGGGGSDIQRLNVSELKAGGEVTIRLIGDVLPNYVHWVQTTNGWRTRNACNFDRNTESFDESVENPINKHIVPQFDRAAAQFAYVTNVIKRNPDGTNDGVFLMELKQSIYRQVVDYAKKTKEFGDPSDSETGYDFTIQKVSTGPKKQNVKYQLFPSRTNTPLTDEEKALPLFDLEKLHRQETPDEQLAWIRENTSFLAMDTGSDIPGDETGDEDVPFG